VVAARREAQRRRNQEKEERAREILTNPGVIITETEYDRLEPRYRSGWQVHTAPQRGERTYRRKREEDTLLWKIRNRPGTVQLREKEYVRLTATERAAAERGWIKENLQDGYQSSRDYYRPKTRSNEDNSALKAEERRVRQAEIAEEERAFQATINTIEKLHLYLLTHNIARTPHDRGIGITLSEDQYRGLTPKQKRLGWTKQRLLVAHGILEDRYVPTPLPAGWTEEVDPASGQMVYINGSSGARQSVHPVEEDPAPVEEAPAAAAGSAPRRLNSRGPSRARCRRRWCAACGCRIPWN
jgi:hypothetical protein